MEKNKFPPKSRLIFSSSPAAPPPSPIPRAKGSRSAADPILSEYIDESVIIPELILPHYGHQFKPEEIDYESLLLKEKDSVRRLLRSVRDFGVVQIIDHGILTEELRFALANCERIFGLTVGCCTSYGDHEKIVWCGDDDRVMEQAIALIGEQNFRNFR
ncbi:hypothetical protein CDL12_19233 [Handroanthus impetiginosus]|uniref:Non-haem dioxygenase N-terminal domain-containing protein n=1 Tax=Handroanthus impetiginosus TaxID=429701 RepID=A0A2G9GSK7_9LAMI|nr:hypothetical protein CDL12_19233 [Handroanthus impetiginosus]